MYPISIATHIHTYPHTDSHPLMAEDEKHNNSNLQIGLFGANEVRRYREIKSNPGNTIAYPPFALNNSITGVYLYEYGITCVLVNFYVQFYF